MEGCGSMFSKIGFISLHGKHSCFAEWACSDQSFRSQVLHSLLGQLSIVCILHMFLEF